MYKKVSRIITDHFISDKIIENEKKEIYYFGFEVFLSSLTYAIIFLSTAIISHTCIESMLFLFGFITIRLIAGGFHANTYFVCHLLSVINHICFILLIQFCPMEFMNSIAITLTLVSSILILLFAPVDHPNKPFIKTEERRFKRLSRVYSILLFIISILSYYLPRNLYFYSLSFSIGTFSAAFALMSAKIIKVKEQQKNEEVS